MKANEYLVELARNEIGYTEKASNANLDDKTGNAGKGNFTKYARDLAAIGAYTGSKQGYAWCDQFFDWLIYKAFGESALNKMLGQPKGAYGAGCNMSANYYKALRRFFKSPEIGDQIFFKSGAGKLIHTGIVESVDNEKVHTIEGNVRPAGSHYGGCVGRKDYTLGNSKIAGYGRPVWPSGEFGAKEADKDFYRFITDIPDKYGFRRTVQTLIDARIINGENAEHTLINMSHDTIRLLVILYRGGAFDRALKAAGMNPAVKLDF